MKKCINCKINFKIKANNQKYCSNKCKNEFLLISRNCDNCNKLLIKHRSLKNQKLVFCDNKCQSEFNYKSFINDWLNNKKLGIKKVGWQNQISNYIRRYMLERANYSCSNCNWNKLHEDGSSPLHIDHVDGNAINNNILNLRVLCPNCHSLTSTFGSRNKNSTRYNKSIR